MITILGMYIAHVRKVVGASVATARLEPAGAISRAGFSRATAAPWVPGLTKLGAG